MKRLGSGALEPTSIDKAPRDWKFTERQTIPANDAPADPYMPTAWQRARGYWADPETCLHHRTTFITRWRCSDCGVEL